MSMKKLRALYDGLQAKILPAASPKDPSPSSNSDSGTASAKAETLSPEEKKGEAPATVSTAESDKVASEPAGMKLKSEEEKGKKPDKEQLTKKILRGYNLKWLKEWQFTINYRMWQLIHSQKLFSFSDFSSTYCCLIQ